MSEERDDATPNGEATFTEEEFINPLDGLLQRTETDPTAPFEAAEALAELKQTDPIAYQKLRARLIGVGFRGITALEDILKKLIREKREEEGGGDEDSQVLVLMAALKGVYLYHSADDTAYADVTIDGHRETYPVKSGQFKKYLRRQYFLVKESAPRAEALSTVIGTAEAQAAYSRDQHEVYIRVANVADRVFLDLGDATHRVVEITENGWDILDVPPNGVRFRRPRGLKAMPEPKKSYLDAVTRLQPIYKLMNLKDEDEFVLTVAWILAAIHGKGPFPVASITAEQGSAKSMRARLMRSTFDAHAVLLRSPFREMREGHIAMKNTYVVAVDNLSSLPQWLSDMHCCAATGGGSTYRSLYTDEDETFFDLKRPQILNGIEDVAIRADLADRSIFFTPKPISDEDRLTEEELWAEFNAVHPDLLGALLDVLAHGLSRRHLVKPKNLPRMADFTTLMMACETALWPEGTFRAAYDRNLAEVTATVLSADSVASAVRDLMQDRPRWEGTATALLEVLRAKAGDQATKAPNWPRNGYALSTRLRRAASNLRKIGIAIEFGLDSSRRIVITAPGEATQAANERTVKPNGAAAEPVKPDAADAADDNTGRSDTSPKSKKPRPRGAGAGRRTP